MRSVGAAALVIAGCGGDAPAGYVGISAATPTGSSAIARDGLVAAYDLTTRLDDGRLRDFGPHGLHGAVERADAEAGRVSGARTFRTVADRVDLPEAAPLGLGGPITVAAWLRVDALGLHQHVVACDDRFVLWIPPSDRWRFADTLGHGAESATPVIAGRWTSVVAVLSVGPGGVLDGDALRLFVDGEPVPTEVVDADGAAPPRWSPGTFHRDDACHIGFESHQGDADHQRMPFVGAVDELLIFERAWTAAEVAAHARAVTAR